MKSLGDARKLNFTCEEKDMYLSTLSVSIGQEQDEFSFYISLSLAVLALSAP